MPNIIIRIPENILDIETRAELVAGINATVAGVEQIPDDPKCSAICWAVVEEIREGNWTCGGVDVTAQAVPVIVQVFLPAGVIDAQARVRYADGIYHAVKTALRDEKRRVIVSSIFSEVPDGSWGVNDSLWYLPDFARHAGFMHLQHLVSR